MSAAIHAFAGKIEQALTLGGRFATWDFAAKPKMEIVCTHACARLFLNWTRNALML
jgi:hypothetical protein